MTNYKGHFIGGMLVWLLSLGLFWHQYSSLPLQQLLPFALTTFFICFLGSLLPDTDTPKSKIGGLLQLTVIVTALLFGFTRFFRDFSNPVASAINTAIVGIAVFMVFVLARPRHRGATHTLRANLIYGLVVFLFFFLSAGLYDAAFFGVLAFLSYFSHLVLDRQVTF
ncbi:MAG: metal-dependent hydrolase [Candidatus Diapherotrites archaeon]|nr:metal-dependent hydrolase [Candidatus Diapherotrites archaeon]